MYKELNFIPTDFNVICGPVNQFETEKSDNGYYLVKGLWGTCFHRIATRKERFEIIANRDPKCAHTYTKIPATLAEKTYFVYVNWQASVGFQLFLPAGGSVIGLSEAQKHISNPNWLSASYLVYCPTGEAPVAAAYHEKCQADKVRIVDSKYNEAIVDIDKITRGFPVRYLAVNEEGYTIK